MLKFARVMAIGCSVWLALFVNLQAGMAQTPPTPSLCQPSEIGTTSGGLPEIQGVSESQSLWALLFPYHLPVRADEDLKIVWRMTGIGYFNVKAQHTDGTVIGPIWGPEGHLGSTWERPGNEWGTGFHFPEPGCWRMLVQRGKDTGEVDLLVVPNEDDSELF